MSHPTLKRVIELFDVCPETGAIRWRRSQGRMAAGMEAGSVHKRLGYRFLNIDRRQVSAHQLVWFVATGDWPPLIDHINGVRSDNRIENLRLADAATNARNRTNLWTGKKLLGAHPTSSGAFRAAIKFDGLEFHLGTYSSEQQAHDAYMAVRAECLRAEKEARNKAVTQWLALQADLTISEEMQADRRAA